MLIHVNGQETEVADALTVSALVAEMGLNPETIVVEHNLNILLSEKWSQVTLAADDHLEIVTFMGGG